MNARYQRLRCSIKYPNKRCTEELAHRWYIRDRRYKPPVVVDLSVCSKFREDREELNSRQDYKSGEVVLRLLGRQAGRYQQSPPVLIRRWTQVGICILQPPEMSEFRQLPTTFQTG